MIRVSTLLGAAAIAASALVSVNAYAAPPTKEECVDAHGKGQDLREKNLLAESKRQFLICAQQVCPALVQSDCARFGEELARTVPSLSFSARDAKGNDLSDTQVFVDGALVTSRLDDGKAHDVDPGKHAVRFTHDGVEVVVNVVATVGDKGRNVSATFGGPPAPPGGETRPATPPGESPTEKAAPSRSAVPLVVAGFGGAALVTGVILAVVGQGNVPDKCDTSSNQCKAPPGDPVFDDASSAVKLSNLGVGIGIGGLVLGVGGLVWYFLSSPKEASTTNARLLPAVRSNGGGFQLSF